jgi:glyoxylase-like metal-dependent hydrolase (beta-lactamase superfamily II)
MNTHVHLDHVQNNGNFGRQGAVVISTPNLREAMMRSATATPLKGNAGFPKDGVPEVTSTGPLTVYLNGEEVFFLPLKPAHTNGDAAVYFRGSDVWVFGDVYRGDYPSLGESGTTPNFIENYNDALEMTTSNTVFIPGHGQLSRRDDLIALRDAVITIHGRFKEMVASGMTVQQILDARPSREFDARFASENQSATTGNTVERWYRSLYAELTR